MATGRWPGGPIRARRAFGRMEALTSPEGRFGLPAVLAPGALTPGQFGQFLTTQPRSVVEIISIGGAGEWVAPFTGTVLVEATGAGSLGVIQSSSGYHGGGGGAYAAKTINVVANTSYPYFVGQGLGPNDTIFNDGDVLAKGAVGRIGALASASTGTVKFSGGNGGLGASSVDFGDGGGGGGGAPGTAYGAGANGTNAAYSTGGAGGSPSGGNGGVSGDGLVGTELGAGSGGPSSGYTGPATARDGKLVLSYTVTELVATWTNSSTSPVDLGEGDGAYCGADVGHGGGYHGANVGQ